MVKTEKRRQPPHSKLSLRRLDRFDRVIVFRFEQSQESHISIGDYPVTIDDKNRSRHLAGNQRLCAITVGDFSVRIRQQTQRQLVMGGKALVRFDCVCGNADDFRPGGRIVFPTVAHRAHLSRTDWRFVAGIKEQHDYPATMIRQTPRRAVAVRQREVRSLASFLGM
jgi:hypothetical protein